MPSTRELLRDNAFLLAVLATMIAVILLSRAITTAPVTGKVIDKATSKPIRDAKVALGGNIVRTDSAGRFDAGILPTSRPRLTAHAWGYKTARRHVDIASNLDRLTKWLRRSLLLE